MDKFAEELSKLDTGLTLEPGAGEGGFIKYFCENVKSYDSLIGADLVFNNVIKARENTKFDKLSYLAADICSLPLPDSSVDTVALSHTLHHLRHADRALDELQRVVKNSGLVIIRENYFDPNYDFENSWHQMHHWYADVDQHYNIPHRHTFKREELLGLINRYEYSEIEMFDYTEPYIPAVKFSESKEAFLRADEKLAMLKKRDDLQDLYEAGLRYKEILLETGCHPDPELIMIGRIEKN